MFFPCRGVIYHVPISKQIIFIIRNVIRVVELAKKSRPYTLPSAAISYAKILQTSAMQNCLHIAECSYILCKDSKSKFLYQTIW